MENSKIEWTDHTFNPWIGCTKVSPGCAHCYAETLMDTRYGRVKWGKGNPRSRTSESNWREPLKWDEEAAQLSIINKHNGWEHQRPRVFCASLADWLDDEVPIEWLIDLLTLIDSTKNLDWLLLTKRPQNFLRRINAACHGKISPYEVFRKMPNIWVGTSVENQQAADERIPELLKIPASVRFLSCEPLLENVDLTKVILEKSQSPERGKPDVSINSLFGWYGGADKGRSSIHWVICGGESGPGARPMHPEWARSLRDQCAAAGVPFLFKQWGDWVPTDRLSVKRSIGMPGQNGDVWAWCDGTRDGWKTGLVSTRVGRKTAGRFLDGVEHNGFPKVEVAA